MWTLFVFLFSLLPLPVALGGEDGTKEKAGAAFTREAGMELSQEDREILGELEILENLELLKDLDAVKYFPFLAKIEEEEEQ